MIRIRRRAVGLLGGALLLFLAATNIQSGWLFSLSSLLLGALVAGTLVPLTMVRGLQVERRGPPEAFVGDLVPIELVIENLARGTRISVVVRDPHVAPTVSFLPAIRAGERVKVRTLRLATRRGVVEAAPVEVASTAPFGVAEARRSIESSGRIVIFPQVVPLGRLPFLQESAGSVSDPGPIAQRGEGQEFIGVRDYREGDSLRSIHWPSTARRGALVVREMEVEHPAGLVILMDTWADGGTDQTVMDLCCTVAGSVAMKALSTGHDVLLAAAEKGRAEPPARMGKQEALTWLAGLASPGGLPFPAVVEQIGPVSARAAFLIVLPTWRPNSAAALHRAVARIAAGGMSVVAVLIDAARFVPRAATLDPAGVLELERSLASAGADVRRVASLDDLGPGPGRPVGPATVGAPLESRR